MLAAIEGREEKAGSEPAAGHEEVARAAHPPREVEADRDLDERVDGEDEEGKAHFAAGARSRSAGMPGTPVASRAARTIASAIISAARAPI